MDHIAETYGIPADLMAFVNVGFLEVLSEKPDVRTIVFHIPSLLYHDHRDRATYSLTWIHPDFNAQHCHYYEKEPGALPNFHLVMDTDDVGDEFVDDLDTVEALVTWLGGASEGVRRRKAGNPRPTPDELAEVLS